MPDGVIYKPCGNRRVTTCPGCAETYRRDAYHLIRAGLTGGKGITPDVATHPAVFVTFTAPSFGPVHTRPVRQHTCTDKVPLHAAGPSPATPAATPSPANTADPPPASPATARDDPGSASRCARTATTTPPTWCGTTRPGSCGGAPSKPSNAASASSPATAACPPIRVPAATAGTGWSPRSASRTAKPPNTRPAARSTSTPCSASTATTPPTPAAPAPAPRHHRRRPPGRRRLGRRDHQLPHRAAPGPARRLAITWGTETDVRVITMTGTGTVTDLAVASYLAKYSTKGTETTGHASARITADTIDLYANPDGTHPERLIAACWRLGRHPGYASLRRWAHMLGFGGHFLTKARRYSIRFRDLRQARITYRRSQDTGPEHGPIRTADHADDETILIIGTFTYAGTGWKTSGDALLANTAADQARKRRQAGRDELADEYNRAATGRQAA